MAAAFALFGGAVGSAMSCSPGSSYLYPNIADTSHATPELVNFIHELFTAKTRHDAEAFASLFTPSKMDAYFDAVVGIAVPQTGLAAALNELWNGSATGSKSYPLRIVGNMHSAAVWSVDTPGLFGPTEVRPLSTIDFTDGKANRWVDYWDGRLSPSLADRTPENKFPKTFGEEYEKTKPNPAMNTVATKLYDALSSGNATMAADLFTPDAVFEDRSTRTQIEGQIDIQQYLGRVLHIAPYGVGSKLRHIVGSSQGGAYEWIGNEVTGTPNGVTGLELNSAAEITSLSIIWDASRTRNATLETLVQKAIIE